MKELYTRFIGKVGIDRVAHFTLSGLVVAVAAFFGWWPMAGAFVLMTILAAVKELKLDAYPDWWDFFASVAGGLLAGLAKLVEYLVLF